MAEPTREEALAKAEASEEALAEALASMDGKLELFLANKADCALDTDGPYARYLAGAYELIGHLEQRGYTVREVCNG